MTLATAFSLFWAEFIGALPVLLARFFGAWIVTFIVLIYGFQWLKKHIRPAVLRLDERIRFWALGLRYRTRGDLATERHFWTWFFRFWTNFCSSPSLTVISLAVAIAGRAALPAQPRLFFLPALCFAFSMLTSYVSKKVFKRIRPERPHGAFGHKLRDGSFPSGHSLTSLAFWGMLAVCVFLAAFPLWLSAILALCALAVPALTGLSRIYLGVHWPSDVFGGFAIGAVCSVVCYFAFIGIL